jgi:uncharacterized membrane-anchored protein
MQKSTLFLCVSAAALACLAVPASADAPVQPAAPAASGPQAELEAAWGAARKTAILGPAKVRLLDQGEIAIRADEVFVPAAEANRIMVAMGNPASPARFGLIVSRKDNANWLVDVDWIKEGYVRDEEAKDWQPDALLASLKENTERDNAGREARNLPALDVVGWAQPPAYDKSSHRLVWSMLAKERGAPANQPQTINYNTYALGREGYFSLDLITDSAHIAADRKVAEELLGSLNFAQGKRYQDFNGSTDKVAAYGLAALVGVVAVKKLGLLAMLGIFLVKVWKLALIAIVGGMAAMRKFFRRKREGEDAAL